MSKRYIILIIDCNNAFGYWLQLCGSGSIIYRRNSYPHNTTTIQQSPVAGLRDRVLLVQLFKTLGCND